MPATETQAAAGLHPPPIVAAAPRRAPLRVEISGARGADTFWGHSAGRRSDDQGRRPPPGGCSSEMVWVGTSEGTPAQAPSGAASVSKGAPSATSKKFSLVNTIYEDGPEA